MTQPLLVLWQEAFLLLKEGLKKYMRLYEIRQERDFQWFDDFFNIRKMRLEFLQRFERYFLLLLHALIYYLLLNPFNNMKVFVYTDGWSRWNPGIAGCGVYITDESWNPLERRFKSIGIATNNIAEYTAALLGIERAVVLWATDIALRADSQLAIEQLKGNYKVKNPELKKLYLQIQDILATWWGRITFEHIPREQNKEADRLSNVAMDKYGS